MSLFSKVVAELEQDRPAPKKRRSYPNGRAGKGWDRQLPKNTRDPEHKVTLKGLGVSALRLEQDRVVETGALHNGQFSLEEEAPKEVSISWNKSDPLKPCGQFHHGPCQHHPEIIGMAKYGKRV